MFLNMTYIGYNIRVRDFCLCNTISVVVFLCTIYSLATTCFGRTTIFRQKYVQRKII
jgi:hypothetical protein